MRSITSNEARIIVKEAVKEVRNDQSTFKPRTGASFTPSGSSTTTMGTNEDGSVFTIHPMIWDLDDWDDEGSVWS